jgi:hypothetical protein
MPDSFGKRHRDDVKARKAAARDARRVARTQRRAARDESGSTPEEGILGVGADGQQDAAQLPERAPDPGEAE